MTVKIDIDRAIVDYDYAKQCYIEKLNGKNIDNAQIKEIEKQYSSAIKGWKAEAEQDDNSYDVEDLNTSALTRSVEEETKKAAQKEYKYKGKTKNASKAAIVDAGIAVAGVVGKEVVKKVVTERATKIALQYAWDGTNKLVRDHLNNAAQKIASGALGTPSATAASNLSNFAEANFRGEMAPNTFMGNRVNDALKQADAIHGNALENFQEVGVYNNGDACYARTVGDSNKANNIQWAGENEAKEAAKDTGKSAGALAGCLMAFATGTKYMLQRPNKEETHELYRNLMPQMESGEVDLGDAETDMEESNSKIESLQDSTDKEKSELDKQIEMLKAEIETKQKRQDELKAKSETEELSEQDKAELETLGTEIAGLNTQITNLTASAGEKISDNNDKIQSEEETMTNAQETVETVRDVADYAESFDKDTRTMCIVEAASQGLNAYNGTKSSIQAYKLASSGSWAFGATSWAYVVAGMGAAGAAASTFGVGQQISFVDRINKEIDVREQVQKTVETTENNVEDNTENLEKAVDTTTRTAEEVKENDETVVNNINTNVITNTTTDKKDEEIKKEELV